VALPVALVGALLLIGPVAADTELGTTGQVGAHSLSDTDANGGAKCSYVTTSQGETFHNWQLRRLDVRPPRMRAISGQQTVGWRFIVDRSTDDEGPWTTTFRSRIQKRTTSTSSNAAFSTMGVKVNVPSTDDFYYRIRVKMFWFTPKGGHQGTSTHSIDFYRVQNDAGPVRPGDHRGVCYGNEASVV